VPFEAESVNLNAGAQRCPEFLKINRPARFLLVSTATWC
jgi:hypothetical protein